MIKRLTGLVIPSKMKADPVELASIKESKMKKNAAGSKPPESNSPEPKELVKSKDTSIEKSSTKSKESKSKENLAGSKKITPEKVNRPLNDDEDLLSCRYIPLYILATVLFIYCLSVLIFGHYICLENEFRCFNEEDAFKGVICEDAYLTWDLKCVTYNTQEEVLKNCKKRYRSAKRALRITRGKGRLCKRWKLEDYPIIGDILDLF